jgi:hypothetical protein
MTVSSCGSLATACASSFQHAFIGNSTVLQWFDVRLTSTRDTIHEPRATKLAILSADEEPQSRLAGLADLIGSTSDNTIQSILEITIASSIAPVSL